MHQRVTLLCRRRPVRVWRRRLRWWRRRRRLPPRRRGRRDRGRGHRSTLSGELRVEVRGVGGADPGGHGLIGIEDRATALGGRFTLHSPPGCGTVLTVTLPVAGRPAELP